MGGRRWRVQAVVLLTAIAGSGALATAGAQDTTCAGADDPAAAPAVVAEAVRCLVGDARRQAGVPVLRADARLAAAAQAHAQASAAAGRLSATDPDGTTPTRRAMRAGWRGEASEVLAFGSGTQATPRALVARWLGSAADRSLVLRRAAVAAGTGVARPSSGPFAGGTLVALVLGDPERTASGAVPGRSVLAEVVSGTVTVTPPRARGARAAQAAVPLAGAQVVTLGSTVDATRGRVRITSAPRTGVTERSEFFDGAFVVRQRRSGRSRVAVMTLTGGREVTCPTTRASAAQKRRRKRERKLWGDGKGRYQTKGQDASATVRGTRWLTEDSCAGTRVTVRRGVVRVRDLRTNRVRTVRAGQSVLVRGR